MMPSFQVGDEVSWKYVGGTEQGQITAISGLHAKVEYGPWSDTAWFPMSSLTNRSR